VNLLDENLYVFHSGARGCVPEADARFVLLAGSSEFIDGHDDRLPDPPARTALHRSYPNPFAVSTIIRYDLAQRESISLRIYDATGALARDLFHGMRGPGRYEAVWTGENDRGERVAPGIYFCRLKTSGGLTAGHKLLLVR
jgi:hypothetical protein